MGFTFNIAKGRTVELHNRVANNDPTNAVLVLVAVAESGLETEAVLKDKDTLADVFSGTTNEVTNVGYARKVLDQTAISVVVPDDTNDYSILTFATQTWTTPAAGDSWRYVLVCYDSDSTAGTDANIVPMYALDSLIDGLAVVPNGFNIVMSQTNGYAIVR